MDSSPTATATRQHKRRGPLRVRLALVVWDALWLKMAAQAEAEPGRQAPVITTWPAISGRFAFRSLRWQLPR